LSAPRPASVARPARSSQLPPRWHEAGRTQLMTARADAIGNGLVPQECRQLAARSRAEPATPARFHASSRRRPRAPSQPQRRASSSPDAVMRFPALSHSSASYSERECRAIRLSVAARFICGQAIARSAFEWPPNAILFSHASPNCRLPGSSRAAGEAPREDRARWRDGHVPAF
jgi:hypothetical protein